MFASAPGHHHFVARAYRPRELAQITAHSGHAEVTLVRINRTHIISIGNRHFATATLIMPARSDIITSFEWIAHTHPLEQGNEEQSVSHGATEADRAALARVHERFGQTESKVIVCRGGRVLHIRPFRVGE